MKQFKQYIKDIFIGYFSFACFCFPALYYRYVTHPLQNPIKNVIKSPT